MRAHSQTTYITIFFPHILLVIKWFQISSSRRFGFPNRTSLDAGKSGIDCRGEEHDVNLIWSITSGKKMIMSNGQQIYTGLNKSRIFEYAWHNKNGTHLRILAHSTVPMGSAQGTRQYDLFIDGKSFFNMPKVYEIGLKGSTIDDTRIPGVITDSQRVLMDQFGPQRVQMGYSPSGRNIVAPASAEEVRRSYSVYNGHLLVVDERTIL